MPSQQPIGVCAVLRNQQGKIIVGRRKNSYKAGSYGMPGGRVEYGESLTAAIAREVLEETGLHDFDFSYVGVVRETQEEYDFIHFVFTADVGDAEPELCEPQKCEGWEWYAPQQLPESVLAGHMAAIDMFMNKKTLIDRIGG